MDRWPAEERNGGTGADVAWEYGPIIERTSWFLMLKTTRSLRRKRYTNAVHKPGFLPDFLNDKGINVIISGGIGG